MSLLCNFLQLQAQEKYLSLLLEAVTGDSEDLRRVSSEIGGLMFLTVVIFSLQLALADIQSNPSIANILPDLAQYLEETVSYVIRGREGKRERERERERERKRVGESVGERACPYITHLYSYMYPAWQVVTIHSCSASQGLQAAPLTVQEQLCLPRALRSLHLPSPKGHHP